MIRLIFFLFFSLAVILPGSVESPLVLDLDNPELIQFLKVWKYHAGDDPSWAHPDFDDAGWRTITAIREINQKKKGNHWYRKKILVKGEPIHGDKLAIRIRHIPQAYELYWDGQLVAENGRVGNNRQTEVPGRYSALITIPEKYLTPGSHVLGVRVSNYSRSLYYNYINFYTGYASRLEAGARYYQDKNLLFAGIYLTAILFALALFFGGERHNFYIFFILYCLLNLMDVIINFHVETAPVSIDAFIKLLLAGNIGSAMHGLVLVVFILFFLEISRKWKHILITVLVMILLHLCGFHQLKYISTVEIFTSFYGIFLLVQGARARKPGSWVMLFAFSPPLLMLIYRLLVTMYPGIATGIPKSVLTIIRGVFVASVMLGISIRIRWETRRIEKIKLRAHRLETELLKKNIQPHFIMNTLQSIKSLIAVDRGKAEGLIESLADEFRHINRIYDKKSIPIREEIDLCRNHLKLMEYRREAEYDFEVTSTCGNIPIPPLIILTLVENGLTHAFDPREKGTFRFSCREEKRSIYLTLRNNGSKLQEFSDLPSEKIEEGLGLKYIRTRLEENHGNQWELHHGMSDGMWQVEIIIFKSAEK